MQRELVLNGVLKSLFLAATPKRRELQCEQLLHVVRTDLLTESAPQDCQRTGAMRFTETMWHDHQMILQTGDDGNAVSDSDIDATEMWRGVSNLKFNKNTEVRVRLSFVLSGTQTAITLPEVYLTMLDLDCYRNAATCGTMATTDQGICHEGDNVEVIVRQ